MTKYTLGSGFSTASVGINELTASSYTVNLDSYLITNDSFDALALTGSAWTVTINGGVSALDYDGVFLSAAQAGTAASTVTVGTEGSIYGGTDGVHTTTLANVTNGGIIQGEDEGIFFDASHDGHNLPSTKRITVTNKIGATIAGGTYGIDNFSAASLTVTNAGTISAGDGGYAIWSGGWATITNTKLIQGSIALQASPSLPAGSNTVTNSGTINGTVFVVSGKTSISNSGTINGNYFDIGDDVTSPSRVVEVSIKALAGSTTIKNTNMLRGTIEGGDNDVLITNSNTIIGATNYGYDSDTGDFFQVALNLHGGNDSVTNSKDIYGTIWTGAGNDTVTNSGLINGSVDLGAGVNKLTNSKQITGWVFGGDDGSTISNTGAIYGSLELGAGNDKVTNSGTGTIGGSIELGAGNDSFTGNATAEYVFDNDGNDTYSLGGGNDYYFAAADSGIDKVDGGIGVDTYEADLVSTGALSINLGTTSVTYDEQTFGATTATYGGSAGSEKVTGFEVVDGTSGNDTIFGGAAAETLYGNDGNDIIGGGGGADTLWGGAGNDTFVLLSAKDSGITRATSDTIMDFTQGEDTIDLSKIDANTTVAGFDEFHTLIANGVFSGSAGELRYVYQGGQTIIQGDTNGDKKADFQIALQGTIALQDSDFVGMSA